MIDYKLNKKYNMSNCSKGVQIKYYKDNYWYKVNKKGYEGFSEFLNSILLSCSNIKNYVAYEQCSINGKKGCRSENFLKGGEEFITFQRLYAFYQGGNLYDKIYVYDDVKDRINWTLDFINSKTDLDCKEYLSQVLSLDMLTINNDRHFHNLGVIRKEEGTYRNAPIFDNGAAFLSNLTVFAPYKTIQENIEQTYASPFSGSFEQQALAIGINIKIDYLALKEKLDTVENCRGKNVLLLQMDRYQSDIPRIESGI